MTKQPLTKAERKELRRLHDYASGRFTMRINGENDCRVELANGPSDDERGLHARFRYATGAHAFVAIHNHLPRLLADLDAAEVESNKSITALRYTEQMLLDARAQRDRAEAENAVLRAGIVGTRDECNEVKNVLSECRAQRDRAEAERDAQATELVDERDRAKAKLAALVAINKKVLLQATIRKVPPFNSFFEVGWGEAEEKEWNKALGDVS